MRRFQTQDLVLTQAVRREDETDSLPPLRRLFPVAPCVEDRESHVVSRAVTQAKEGDTDAVRYLYMRYASKVFGYVRSLMPNEHDAEDVTQLVFAKLPAAIQRYEQREVPFKAWILRVARNMAVDQLRRRSPVPLEEVRGGSDHDEEGARDRARSLRDALAELPHEQREVLILRHVVGLSPSEIAEQLGKSEGSVHGLHHRGRRALRVSLRALDLAPATAAA